MVRKTKKKTDIHTFAGDRWRLVRDTLALVMYLEDESNKASEFYDDAHALFFKQNKQLSQTLNSLRGQYTKSIALSLRSLLQPIYQRAYAKNSSLTIEAQGVEILAVFKNIEWFTGDSQPLGHTQESLRQLSKSRSLTHQQIKDEGGPHKATMETIGMLIGATDVPRQISKKFGKDNVERFVRAHIGLEPATLSPEQKKRMWEHIFGPARVK
jgi:hypothetical protein